MLLGLTTGRVLRESRYGIGDHMAHGQFYASPHSKHFDFCMHGVALLLMASCQSSSTPNDPSSDAQPVVGQRVSIYAGGPGGNYFKAASELRAHLRGSALNLEILESPGSFENLSRLGRGQSDLAIAQYDAIITFLGMDETHATMANNSAVVAPLSLEYIHVVLRKKAKIRTFADFKGKRIAVGPARSGSWISAKTLLKGLSGIDIENNKNVRNVPYARGLRLLVEGNLDAMFVTTMPGMPILNALDEKAVASIELMSLPDGFRLPDALRHTYVMSTIAADTYPWQKRAVKTLATPSYLLAYRDFDGAVVTKLAHLIYDDTSRLRKRSNLWRLISRDKAEQDVLNEVPYHPKVLAVLNSY